MSRLRDHGSSGVDICCRADGDGAASACSLISPSALVLSISVRSVALEVSSPVCVTGDQGCKSCATIMQPAPMHDFPAMMLSF